MVSEWVSEWVTMKVGKMLWPCMEGRAVTVGIDSHDYKCIDGRWLEEAKNGSKNRQFQPLANRHIVKWSISICT